MTQLIFTKRESIIDYLYKNIDYKNPHTMFGFGSFTKKNYKSLFHNILQKKIFGKSTKRSANFEVPRKMFTQLWELAMRKMATCSKLLDYEANRLKSEKRC